MLCYTFIPAYKYVLYTLIIDKCKQVTVSCLLIQKCRIQYNSTQQHMICQFTCWDLWSVGFSAPRLWIVVMRIVQQNQDQIFWISRLIKVLIDLKSKQKPRSFQITPFERFHFMDAESYLYKTWRHNYKKRLKRWKRLHCGMKFENPVTLGSRIWVLKFWKLPKVPKVNKMLNSPNCSVFHLMHII